MREKTRRTRRVRWLAALLGAFVLALSVMPVTAWAAGGAVYVSENGSDDNTGFDAQNAVKTLAKAVGIAENGDTIYVMSDLTAHETARYLDKNLTITSGEGGPYTVKRGDNFQGIHNTAEQWHNGALIEVGGTQFNRESSLVLRNIILDDDGKHEGTHYVQVDTTDPGGRTEVSEGIFINNKDIVQDAMITTANNTAVITLGDGAILQNYGGMSAVRVSGGKLVMESGSKIIDTKAISREALDGDYGIAGAVWLQPGGEFVMQSGTLIGSENDSCFMSGRGLYVEGGTAELNGTISRISGEDSMWSPAGAATAAVGVHIINKGDVTVNGSLNNLHGDKPSAAVGVYSSESKFVLNGDFSNNSLMTGIQISNAVGMKSELNGNISANTLAGSEAYCVLVQNSDVVINENCTINKNKCEVSTVNVSSGGHVDLYGHIEGNVVTTSSPGDSAGIIITQYWGSSRASSVDMYDGATIADNTAKTKAAAVHVTRSRVGEFGGEFTMHGGTIEGNKTSSISAAVVVDSHARFVMDGGSIRDNLCTGVRISYSNASDKDSCFVMNSGSITGNAGYGVHLFTSTNNCFVQLLGGLISGNTEESQVFVTGAGAATNDNRNALISSNVLAQERTVGAAGYVVSLDDGYSQMSIGRASSTAKDKINELIAGSSEYAGWTVVGSNALWIKPSADNYHFQISRPSGALRTGLFIAYIQLNADGTPADNAELHVQRVDNDEVVDVTLKDAAADTPYAVMFVNNAEYTLAPDDVTVYTGGGQGDEDYGGGGFPALTIDGSVDPITSLVIDGGTELKGDEAMQALLDRLEVAYYDGETQILDDSVAGEYRAVLSWKDGQKPGTITINGNEVSDELGEGTLVVRYVEDVDEAQDGTSTHRLLTSEPDKAVEHAEAIAKKGDSGTEEPVFYTNGDEGRQAGAAGVQLLDDGLLADEDGTDRQALLEQRAEETVLQDPGAGRAWRYEFRYLDLVDAHNGNAWVSASYGTTVYLPYPDGVTKDDAEGLGVKVVHFPGLHREYGFSGRDEVEDAIAACAPEAVDDVQFTDAGIRFDVDEAGFSPFAVAWQTEARTITATADGGSTVTPSGTFTVPVDEGMTFAVAARAGYAIEDVTLDGASVLDRVSNGRVTVPASDADQALRVTSRSTSGGGGSVTPSERYTITASAGEGGSISPSGTHEYAAGSDVTFTITPDEGWTVGDVTVDGVSYRQLGSYTFEDLDDDHTISVTFMRGSDPASPDETGVSDWLNTSDHVAYLHGYGDGSFTFGPENPMTRAEVAQMFYNLLLDKGMGDRDVAFEDVPEGAYYAEPVRVLASRGILNGTGPETFEPDRPITRAEFVAIAMRFSDGAPDGENPYVDVPDDAWYRDYVVGATSFGWIYGYQDGSGRFGPNDTITRGQATMVTNRMLWRSCDTVWATEHLDELKTFVDLGRGHYAFFDVVEATNAHDFERVGDTRFEDWTGLRE